MLVLSRKVGQRVLIGDNIAVTVVRAAPGVVRIGIDAPPEMAVVREELKGSQHERREDVVAGRGSPKPR